MRTALVLVALPAMTASVLAGGHPRVFISTDDVPRLRAMAADTSQSALGHVPAEVWSRLKARADELMQAGPYHYEVDMPGTEGGPSQRFAYTLSDEPPPRHDDFSHYPPWTGMFQERTDSITMRIQLLTFAFLVSDDRTYFDAAREIVLHLCAWPGIWTDPSYGGGKPCLDTGHCAEWVGLFYDWCYDALTADERATIRASLAEKALAPIDAVMDEISPYHNYTAVIASGLLIGALAIEDDEPRAAAWIEHAIARAKLNFDAQGKDGGAMEGPMYGTYAADQFADMIWALQSTGRGNTLSSHPYVGSLPRYCVALLDPGTNQQPCFGDGGPGVGFARMMIVLALAGDTDAAWYCDRVGALAPTNVRAFLAYDPARITIRQPDLVPSTAFRDVGYAVLRDGYNPDAAFMALKCGPPDTVVGHNHFDHNSFVISAFGTWLAWDPGYRDYFEPARRRYTTSSIGHSTVVLDMDEGYLSSQQESIPGHDQVRLDGATIREFVPGERFDYALGDATAAYNAENAPVLDRFERRVFFAKPHVFFVVDTLAAPAEHRYSFLLHQSRSAEVTTADGEVRIADGQGVLQARTWAPGGVELVARGYSGAESLGPYIAATSTPAREMTFVTALVARRSGELITNGGFERGTAGWQPRDMPGFVGNHVIDDAVFHSGKASARIDNGGYYYSRHFRLPPGARVTARWWARCTAREGASSTLYYWRGGTAFQNTPGPVADVHEWRQYELADTVPEGTDEVCLALQFFGQGQCWYDDVEVEADAAMAYAEPARITPIADGAPGMTVEVDGRTHALLLGRPDTEETYELRGRTIRSKAPIAVVTVADAGVHAFAPSGKVWDGEAELTP